MYHLLKLEEFLGYLCIRVQHVSVSVVHGLIGKAFVFLRRVDCRFKTM